MSINRALQNALDYLQALITEAGRKPNSSRIPPLLQCARKAGVSYQTMWKAAALLKTSGVLNGYPGAGTFVNVGTGAAFIKKRVPCISQVAWERTAIRLCTDIDQGMFSLDAALPSPKELAEHYGVCIKTIRRSLQYLVTQGWIDQSRRSFTVHRRSKALQRQKRVILFCRGLEAGQLLDITPRTHDHLRLLESECARHDLRLTVIPLYYRERSIYNMIQALRSIEKAVDVAGFLVWPMAIPESDVARLLDALNSQDLPSAVLDETGMTEVFRSCSWRPAVRWYSMAVGKNDGKTAGRFLLDRGHHRVAYIQLDDRGVATVRRREGLLEAFGEAGYGDAVQVHSIRGAQRLVFVEAGLKKLDSAIDELVNETAAAVSGPDRYGLSRRFAVQVRHEINRAGVLGGIRAGLFPILERILNAGDITAITGFNDHIALECLEFCRERHVAVPSTVSILGFDDGPDAFLFKMSSYNFNSAAYIHAMVRHITGAPKLTEKQVRRGPVEFEGFVNERETTRSPRQVLNSRD